MFNYWFIWVLLPIRTENTSGRPQGYSFSFLMVGRFGILGEGSEGAGFGEAQGSSYLSTDMDIILVIYHSCTSSTWLNSRTANTAVQWELTRLQAWQNAKSSEKESFVGVQYILDLLLEVMVKTKMILCLANSKPEIFS